MVVGGASDGDGGGAEAGLTSLFNRKERVVGGRGGRERDGRI